MLNSCASITRTSLFSSSVTHVLYRSQMRFFFLTVLLVRTFCLFVFSEKSGTISYSCFFHCKQILEKLAKSPILLVQIKQEATHLPVGP